VPLAIWKLPLFPFTDEYPDASETEPEFPLTVDPELNSREPVIPADEEKPVATTTAPVVEGVVPVLKMTAPVS